MTKKMSRLIDCQVLTPRTCCPSILCLLNQVFRHMTVHPVIWLNYRRLMESRNHHGMPWGQTFELFPGRTPGAIQLRYYIMSHKENGQAKYITESAIDIQLLSKITQIVKSTRDQLRGTSPAQSATAWKINVVPRQLMGHRDSGDSRILTPRSLILKVNSSYLL